MLLNGRLAYQGKKQVCALDHCDAKKRRTMIDVGAHVGLWSYNFSHWFNRVEAFEPVAAHRECWQSNMQHGVLPIDNAELYAFALGAEPGRISIHTADTSSGDSWVSGVGKIEMRTLDSFGFENVDFIKIDCEGYEEFVLRGGEATIEKWRPVVCVEQKRDMARKFGLEPLGAVAFLQKRGYKLADEISGDYILVPS